MKKIVTIESWILIFIILLNIGAFYFVAKSNNYYGFIYIAMTVDILYLIIIYLINTYNRDKKD